jgi:sulfur carrier protein
MMQIRLNGELKSIADNITISMLIEQMGLAGQRYAVEVNESIVPRSRHAQHTLHEHDKVEIVQAIGGG